MDTATWSSKYFNAPAQYRKADMIRKSLIKFTEESSTSIFTPDFVISDRFEETSIILLEPH